MPNSTPTKTSPAFLFSSFQFLHVGFFAYYIAFLPLYLADIGLTPRQIAIQSLFGTITMMFFGTGAAEISGRRLTPQFLSNLTTITSIILFIIFLQTKDPFLVPIIWAIFMGIKFASGMLVDIELLKRNAEGELRFEKIRLWGSIGFIFFGALFGFLFKTYGSIVGSIALLPFLILQAMIGIYLSKYLKLPDHHSMPKLAIFKVLKDRNVFLLFTSVALCWIAHAPIYTYLSLYLERLSYSPTYISVAWNLGVLAEIWFFLVFSAFQKHFSILRILQLSLAVATIRWFLLFSFQGIWIILATQLLHAFSFGAVYLCSTNLAYKFFPLGFKDKSQSYLSLLGIGMGSLVGRLILSTKFAEITDYLDARIFFAISGGISLIALFCSYLIKEDK